MRIVGIMLGKAPTYRDAVRLLRRLLDSGIRFTDSLAAGLARAAVTPAEHLDAGLHILQHLRQMESFDLQNPAMMTANSIGSTSRHNPASPGSRDATEAFSAAPDRGRLSKGVYLAQFGQVAQNP